jgi:hypothetical protein
VDEHRAAPTPAASAKWGRPYTTVERMPGGGGAVTEGAPTWGRSRSGKEGPEGERSRSESETREMESSSQRRSLGLPAKLRVGMKGSAKGDIGRLRRRGRRGLVRWLPAPVQLPAS